jgi:hypothetical protein
MKLYIGLVHYPVYNKNRQKIASAITNFDLHDLSRLSRAYGAKKFFVITPLDDQKDLAGRILAHWTEGYGADYNSLRKEAIELISVVSSIKDAVSGIQEENDESPIVVTTGANKHNDKDKTLSFTRATDLIKTDKPVLLLFGTAWGLHDEVTAVADFILDPIEGNCDYNHLSVRTAAGIILDRLTGR